MGNDYTHAIYSYAKLEEHTKIILLTTPIT